VASNVVPFRRPSAHTLEKREAPDWDVRFRWRESGKVDEMVVYELETIHKALAAATESLLSVGGAFEIIAISRQDV